MQVRCSPTEIARRCSHDDIRGRGYPHIRQVVDQLTADGRHGWVRLDPLNLHEAELARRGYLVHGIDLSSELVAVATQSIRGRETLSFAVGDILTLPEARYDAILCRG
jgi:hypothetical protein